MLIKAGLGSALAIFLADQLNLLYSVSAGIITLLTIQNTRKETLSIAIKRVVAFIVAIILAFVIFRNLNYTIFAFGIFIFFFTAICNLLEIEAGIVMNSVLVTHFLVEQNMSSSLILNEVLLLLIGMSMGIIVNSIMPKNVERIRKEQKIVEEGIKDNLRCIAQILNEGENYTLVETDYRSNFSSLNLLIGDLLAKAYEDAGNYLIDETRYQISYLEMRRLQVGVLYEILESVESIDSKLPQSKEVADYVHKVANEFHEFNNVKQLLTDLSLLYDFFRDQSLPKTRLEFENRAILYSVLRDLESFLQVKRSFIQQN